MKITILQGAFLPVPPILGGAAEKMWYALSKEFARMGHEVVYVSRAYPGMATTEHEDGVLHTRVPGYDWPSMGLYLKWLDLLYTIRAKSAIPADSDVVVTNTFWAPILLSASLKRKCMVDVARMPKGQMKFYFHSRLRGNSTPVAQAIQKELPAKHHNRILMIPNPLPFVGPPQVDFSTKKPILLFTGRVHPEKGIGLLISSFKRVSKNWKLQIVGSAEVRAGGGGEQYLESLKALAAGHDVEFVGAVNDINKLNQYYAAASIFVYPSLAEKGETFGLAPLEAMAWGCVPVVSNLSCFHDFIKNESNGLIFDHRSDNSAELLAKAIERLQSDKEYKQKLAKSALAVQQTHSTSYIAQQFVEEFNKIVAENKD